MKFSPGNQGFFYTRFSIFMPHCYYTIFFIFLNFFGILFSPFFDIPLTFFVGHLVIFSILAQLQRPIYPCSNAHNIMVMASLPFNGSPVMPDAGSQNVLQS